MGGGEAYFFFKIKRSINNDRCLTMKDVSSSCAVMHEENVR